MEAIMNIKYAIISLVYCVPLSSIDYAKQQYRKFILNSEPSLMKTNNQQEAALAIIAQNGIARRHLMGKTCKSVYVKDLGIIARESSVMSPDVVIYLVGHLYRQATTHLALKKTKDTGGKKTIAPVTRNDVSNSLNSLRNNNAPGADEMRAFLEQQLSLFPLPTRSVDNVSIIAIKSEEDLIPEGVKRAFKFDEINSGDVQ